MHDPRVGRFFATDPLEVELPWNSPYVFSENRVLDGVELEGLEFVPRIAPFFEASNSIPRTTVAEQFIKKQGQKHQNGIQAYHQVKI